MKIKYIISEHDIVRICGNIVDFRLHFYFSSLFYIIIMSEFKKIVPSQSISTQHVTYSIRIYVYTSIKYILLLRV